jgi:serine/threonine-protein kinase HipA
MTKRKCLYCYQSVSGREEIHAICSRKFFGLEKPPVILYSLDQMAELAKNVVQRSVTVPGVQPKLPVSLSEEAK